MSVSDRWTDLLRESGYEPGAELGSGMEGTVISLGDDLVAKIWHSRGATELETLQTFYKALCGSGAAFDAPDILQILCLQEQCATVERLLRGRPLSVRTDTSTGVCACWADRTFATHSTSDRGMSRQGTHMTSGIRQIRTDFEVGHVPR